MTRAWDNDDRGAESGCVERMAVDCVSVIWTFWDLSISKRTGSGYLLAVMLAKYEESDSAMTVSAWVTMIA